jgi:hypothetical protein
MLLLGIGGLRSLATLGMTNGETLGETGEEALKLKS